MDSVDLDITAWVMDIIRDTVQDVDMLNMFTSRPLVSASLLGRTGETLVPLDDPGETSVEKERDSSDIPLVLVLLLSLLVFLLVILILVSCGMGDGVRAERKTPPKTDEAPSRTSRKWNQIEEVQSRSHATSEPCIPQQVQSSTWSISDITYETNSHETVKGSTKMDHIDEEVPIDEYEQDRADAAELKHKSQTRPSATTKASRKWSPTHLRESPLKRTQEIRPSSLRQIYSVDMESCVRIRRTEDLETLDCSRMMENDNVVGADAYGTVQSKQVTSPASLNAPSSHVPIQESDKLKPLFPQVPESVHFVEPRLTTVVTPTNVSCNSSTTFSEASSEAVGVTTYQSTGSALGTISDVRSFWAPSPFELRQEREQEIASSDTDDILE